MNEVTKFLYDNWVALITLSLGYLGGYLTLFLKERVKNQAYLADLRKMEEEKESVRREYQLDIDKRKYKYESKREQFVKYFTLIDDFTANSNKEIQAKFFPMITAYNQEYLNAYGNRKKENAAITKFSDGVQNLMLGANEDLIRLRTETNAIKIIAGIRTIELINEMDKLYDKSFDLSSQMVRELISAVTSKDFTNINRIENDLKIYADRILSTKQLMIDQIRIELDEI